MRDSEILKTMHQGIEWILSKRRSRRKTVSIGVPEQNQDMSMPSMITTSVNCPNCGATVKDDRLSTSLVRKVQKRCNCCNTVFIIDRRKGG